MQNRDERFADVAELAQALLPFAPPSSAVHVERAIRLLSSNSVDWVDARLYEPQADPLAESPWSWRPLSVAAATVVASALATMLLVHSCTPRLPEVRLHEVRLPAAGERPAPALSPADDASRSAELVRWR